MGTFDTGLLLAPDFPQADNPKRVIDAGSVQIIYAVIQAWMNPHKGDKIIVSFNANIHFPYIVDNPSADSFRVPCYASMIPDGTYAPTYTVVEFIGQSTVSAPADPFTVEDSAVISYPPLQFIDAAPLDGTSTLTYGTISAHNGARAFVSYYNMKSGDLVDIYFAGADASGVDVPQASQPIHYKVGDDDIEAGGILVTYDADKVIGLGNGGKARGWYFVRKDNEPTPPKPTYVRLSWADVKQLQMTTTQYAPLRFSDYPHLNPYNQVNLFGSPGIRVWASVDPVAVILEAEGSDDPTTYPFQLDGQGRGTFKVAYIGTTQHVGGAVLVSAFTQPSTSENQPPAAWKTAIFTNYRVGPGDIKAYRFTTNAAADGVTACMICLVVDLNTAAPYIQVSIRETDSHASIIGGANDGKTAKIYWNKEDGSATFRVIDNVAEIVTLNIDLPGALAPSSIDDPYVMLNFTNFPDFHIG